MDGSSYVHVCRDTDVTTEDHDLSTPRGRLLYLRDVTVPAILLGELRMHAWDCGTQTCLAGHACRDPEFQAIGLVLDSGGPSFAGAYDFSALKECFGISAGQARHLFWRGAYGLSRYDVNNRNRQPTHAELRAHIDDVLEGRVR